MEGEDGIGAILVPEFYRPIRTAAQEHIWYKWRPLNCVNWTLQQAVVFYWVGVLQILVSSPGKNISTFEKLMLHI